MHKSYYHTYIECLVEIVCAYGKFTMGKSWVYVDLMPYYNAVLNTGKGR